MKLKGPKKTTVISALTARTQLGEIMRRAAGKGERFLVGRRGQPSVVIMGIEDYVDTVSPAPDWFEAAWKEAETGGADKLTPREIEREIKAHRKTRRRLTA